MSQPVAHEVSDPVHDFRSIFISDVHLGNPHSRAAELAEFLASVRARYLYLVGDFIDGWELRRSWKWSPDMTRVFAALTRLSERGTQIRYVTGNHDSFLRNQALRETISALGVVDIADEFTHCTVRNRRLLIIHGDHLDRFERCSAAFSALSSVAYHLLLRINRALRQFGKDNPCRPFSHSVKQRLGTLKSHISDFHSNLARYAVSRGFEGVVCGHIHEPAAREWDGCCYHNTGDWLEHCSAVVEHHDGSMHLHFPTAAPSESVAFPGLAQSRTDDRKPEGRPAVSA